MNKELFLEYAKDFNKEDLVAIARDGKRANAFYVHMFRALEITPYGKEWLMNPKKDKLARRKRGNISKKGEFVQERFWYRARGLNGKPEFFPVSLMTPEQAKEYGCIFRKQTILKVVS